MATGSVSSSGSSEAVSSVGLGHDPTGNAQSSAQQSAPGRRASHRSPNSQMPLPHSPRAVTVLTDVTTIECPAGSERPTSAFCTAERSSTPKLASSVGRAMMVTRKSSAASARAQPTSGSRRRDDAPVGRICCTDTPRASATASSAAMPRWKLTKKELVMSSTCASVTPSGRCTMIVDSSAHEAPMPSHTPHASSGPKQHRPDASSTPAQHAPAASTTTALPPHTPQASRLPDGQHSPFASSTAVTPEQQSPRGVSTPSQHVLLRSSIRSAPHGCVVWHWPPVNGDAHIQICGISGERGTCGAGSPGGPPSSLPPDPEAEAVPSPSSSTPPLLPPPLPSPLPPPLPPVPPGSVTFATQRPRPEHANGSVGSQACPTVVHASRNCAGALGGRHGSTVSGMCRPASSQSRNGTTSPSSPLRHTTSRVRVPLHDSSAPWHSLHCPASTESTEHARALHRRWNATASAPELASADDAQKRSGMCAPSVSRMHVTARDVVPPSHTAGHAPHGPATKL
mmetsp:Transcript_784/g.2356  ORF Transcript_784/g.2356 Transcript_784/m.2356 type:complete len:512 (-) Transcript_784:7300-8835(-)